METKNIWELKVLIKGKAPKQRLIKNHRVKLGELPDTGQALTTEQVFKFTADAYNESLLYRDVEQIALIAVPQEIKDYGGGSVMRGQLLFDPRQQAWIYSEADATWKTAVAS
jgi:hypothetical protein